MMNATTNLPLIVSVSFVFIFLACYWGYLAVTESRTRRRLSTLPDDIQPISDLDLDDPPEGDTTTTTQRPEKKPLPEIDDITVVIFEWNCPKCGRTNTEYQKIKPRACITLDHTCRAYPNGTPAHTVQCLCDEVYQLTHFETV